MSVYRPSLINLSEFGPPAAITIGPQDLPAGNWILTAKANIHNPNPVGDFFQCGLTVNGTIIDIGTATLAGARATITMAGATVQAAPWSVSLICGHDADLDPNQGVPFVSDTQIVAIAVGTVQSILLP